MKEGKVKLRKILHRETGIPIRDIINYGKYENFGNKERLEIGAHTIVARNGEISMIEPVYRDEEVTYKARVVN